MKSTKKNKKQRWVIKAGSNIICDGGPLLLRAWMQQVEKLQREHQIEVIWVTSGAIATAVDRLQHELNKTSKELIKNLIKKQSLADKQALSAIGQPLIMELYNIALASCSLTGAQILLTYDDLMNRVRRTNFENTVEKLLSINAIPIINENDAVATDEIKFGDNDSLSAKIARTCGATRLVILTDVDGLFDSDPTKNKNAKLISEVPKITASVLKLAGGSTSGRGTGGMSSKLMAAREAAKSRIETVLLKGDRTNGLIDLANAKSLGTRVGRGS